ncbi:hypothetical protein N9L47_00085 [Rhodobacteraceae bacterium]|nr:hypothetical protein [Paracoccaceae bacterium]
MKKKITLAAYLAGVTTIAVSLPVMAQPHGKDPIKSSVETRIDGPAPLNGTLKH